MFFGGGFALLMLLFASAYLPVGVKHRKLADWLAPHVWQLTLPYSAFQIKLETEIFKFPVQIFI